MEWQGAPYSKRDGIPRALEPADSALCGVHRRPQQETGEKCGLLPVDHEVVHLAVQQGTELGVEDVLHFTEAVAT